MESNSETYAEGKDRDKGTLDNHLDTTSPFGTFKRSATGPFSAGPNGSSSPWSAAPIALGFLPWAHSATFHLVDPWANLLPLERKGPVLVTYVEKADLRV
jgi:hypothetical protein